eukprot:630577-Ditylum_brightwellii.AAC.1
MEEEGGHKTSVRFEWAVPKGTKTFNIHTSLTKALNLMKTVDPRVYIQDVNNEVQKTSKEYPLGK